MNYYLKVYKSFLSINLSRLLAHRGNYLNSLLASISWGIFGMLTVLLLTYKVDSIFGWSKEDFILIAGVHSIVVGFFHTLFTRNFARFSEIIHYGRLDLLLVKPIDNQFMMTTQYVNFTSLSRILIGIFVIAYLVQKNLIVLNLLNFVGFIFMIFIGLLILYNIWLLALTLTMWFTKISNLPEFMFSLSGMTRFPAELYKEVSYYLFLFLLPLTIVVVTPVKIIIQRASLADLFTALFVVLILTIIARKFWYFALRFYTSAGG